MTEAQVRVCVECAHFKGQQAQLYLGQYGLTQQPECMHPEASTRDLVTGKCLCHAERNDKKGCGKQGRLWTAK